MLKRARQIIRAKKLFEGIFNLQSRHFTTSSQMTAKALFKKRFSLKILAFHRKFGTKIKLRKSLIGGKQSPVFNWIMGGTKAISFGLPRDKLRSVPGPSRLPAVRFFFQSILVAQFKPAFARRAYVFRT